MEKVENAEEIIAYLKQSREELIMMYREIGEKIALRYINDKILDYESFLLIETLYNETLYPKDYSDCYDELRSVMDAYQDGLWNDLEESFDEHVRDKSDVSLNAIARGFVDGVMEFWLEIKDQV